MKTEKLIKRKVVCVFGKWGKDTDFVIEPYVEGDEEVIGKSFWIQEVRMSKQNKKEETNG